MKKSKKKEHELPQTQLVSQVVINVKPQVADGINILPGYEKEECEFTLNNTNSVCWNCCHNIDGEILSQPLKYDNGVFPTVGNFCSYACIMRFIIESNESTEIIFSKLATLNLYNNIKNKTRGLVINPAPSKFVLQMFGGDMDIAEYRNKNKDYLITTNIDPITKCVDLSVKELNIKKKNVNDTIKEFKLYRKNKKVNTNDIYASMKLVSEE